MIITELKRFKAAEFTGGSADIGGSVKEIIERVREEGNSALKYYTEKFDGTVADFSNALNSSEDYKLEEKLKVSLNRAADNIRAFSEEQLKRLSSFEVEISPGVRTGQRIVPVDSAGIYVPGGNYPLISSVLMGVIPAKAAGVRRVAVFTPPGKSGKADESLLAAAEMCGADAVYTVGGAQAIAAAAWGTETIRSVDFIAGPGNIYVTEAKRQVFGRVGIDFIAGPSEVYIVADDYADPSLIAADMIAQAEHDVNAVSVSVVFSEEAAQKIEEEVERQLVELPTSDIAEIALERGGAILIASDMDEAAAFVNSAAPEHLELNLKDADIFSCLFRHYGSLFIGENSAEVFGDYVAGINHTLPTAGAARYTGGLSAMNFLKFTTTLKMDKEAAAKLSETAATIADYEGLKGHANAARLRS